MSPVSIRSATGTATMRVCPSISTTPTAGRYLVVWLTSLPADGGGFRGRVAEVEVQAVDDGG